MDNSYVSWDNTWQVLEDRDRDRIDENVAFDRLIKIFKNAHGNFMIRNNKLMFRGEYDYTSYKFSTSVIGSDDEHYKVEQSRLLINKISEEQSVLKFYLDRINDAFESYSPMNLQLLYDRYFNGLSTTSIQKKYALHKNKYYYIIETSEYLAKEAMLLIKPSPAMIEHKKWLKSLNDEIEKKRVKDYTKKIYEM